MKNLENYGVQELNAKEIKETDGGLISTLDSAISFSLSGIHAVIDFSAGVMDRLNKYV
jgi:hypothetical protein